MSDIFVSYSSADRDRVEPLANALRAEGWSVWWDRTIPAGQNYHEVIEAALAAARCVIVVWSAESIKSEWVRAEAEDGQQRHLLVPVRIDGAVPPLIFRQIQTADLRGWSGDTAAEPFRRLVDDVHALLGTVGAEPEPPPEPPSPNRRAWIIGGVAVATVIAVAVGIGRSGGPEPSPAGPADGGAHPAEAVAQERTRGSVCFTPGTTFDLDDGRWNAPLEDADLFYENKDGTERYLRPWSGSSIAFRASTDVDAVSYADLQAADYSSEPINSSRNQSNQLTPGAVVFVRTGQGRLAKLRVAQPGGFLRFDYVTYRLPGEGASPAQPVSGPCTQEEQNQCDAGRLSGDAIDAFQVSALQSNQAQVEVEVSVNPGHGPVYAGAFLLDANGEPMSGGYRPTAVPGSGKVSMPVLFDMETPTRSRWLYVWLYEANKAEGFVCRRFEFSRGWGG